MSKVFSLQGWLSGSTRVVGTAAPGGGGGGGDGGGDGGGGGPSGNLRTFFATWGLPSSMWGTAVTPDDVYSDANGVNLVTATTGKIPVATAAGACIIVRVTGANSGLMNADKSFSPTLWKSKFDSFYDDVIGVSGGLQRLKDAVKSGVFR